MSEREKGRCLRCKRFLLLNPGSHLCLVCENNALKEDITELELSLEQCRREKRTLYDSLLRKEICAGESA